MMSFSCITVMEVKQNLAAVGAPLLLAISIPETETNFKDEF